MTTNTVPTGTTSPSATRIRATSPAAGEGISTVVLSVWISTSGSSSAISCPSETSQRATSPSVSPSPRSGSLNSYAIESRSLENAVACRVERLQLRRGGRRPGERVPEQREQDRVPRLLPRRRDQPAPQPRLLDEAELSWHSRAPLVRRVDADLDPVGAAQLESDPGQRRGRLGRVPLAGRRGADPVADLERDVVACTRVQPAAADDLGLVGREEPVDEVL